MKIKLFCAQGMSTSLLVEKMKGEIKENNLSIEVGAYSINSLENELEDCDIALLGPQIGYMFDELEEKCKEANVKCGKISMIDYGMMNGKNVLKEALEL